MVITYGAHKRPPYLGYQSAKSDPDLHSILVPIRDSLTLGHSRDIQQKKIKTREPP